jgi:hypothetical protein
VLRSSSCRLRVGQLGERDPSQVALQQKEFPEPRSVQSRLVDGASQIGDENPRGPLLHRRSLRSVLQYIDGDRSGRDD